MATSKSAIVRATVKIVAQFSVKNDTMSVSFPPPIEQMVTRPISSDEPRLVGVICDPTKFDEVMEVPVSMLSSKKYETNIAVDVTEPGGQAIITPGGKILLQHALADTIPWILVTVSSWWPTSR